MQEGSRGRGGEEENACVRGRGGGGGREGTDGGEGEGEGIEAGGEGAEGGVEAKGVEGGDREEGEVGASGHLDELRADLPAGEHVPRLQHLVLQRRVEVQLHRVTLLLPPHSRRWDLRLRRIRRRSR